MEKKIKKKRNENNTTIIKLINRYLFDKLFKNENCVYYDLLKNFIFNYKYKNIFFNVYLLLLSKIYFIIILNII